MLRPCLTFGRLQHNNLSFQCGAGTYTDDGNTTVFIKHRTQAHVFYTFKVANVEDTKTDDNIVTFNQLRFRQRNGTLYETKGVNFRGGLMYHDNHLYSFGNTLSGALNRDVTPCCIVYDCNTMQFDLRTLIPSRAEKEWLAPHNNMAQIIGGMHLFCSYQHYAIFVASFREMRLYILNTHDMSWQLRTVNFDWDDPDIPPLREELIRSVKSGTAKCCVIRKHYLLFVQKNQLFICDIRNVINGIRTRGKWYFWTKVGSLNIQSKRFSCCHVIVNKDEIFLCDLNCTEPVFCKIYDKYRMKKSTARVVTLADNDNSSDSDYGDDYDIPSLRVNCATQSSDAEWGMWKGLQHETLDSLIVVANRIIGLTRHNHVYVSSVWRGDIPDGARYVLSSNSKIGLGASSHVYLGSRLIDNKDVVIKQMDDTDDTDDYKSIAIASNNEETIYNKLRYCKLSWISCHFYQ